MLRQRGIWNALPAGEAKDRLRDAMLAHAWTLLDAGQGEAADALQEFLPESDQDGLLPEFFPEVYARHAATSAAQQRGLIRHTDVRFRRQAVVSQITPQNVVTLQTYSLMR